MEKMFSALNRSSRSSSANSLRSQADTDELISVPIDVNVIETVDNPAAETRSVNGDDCDDRESYMDWEDSNMAYTRQHPLGQIFLGLLKDTFYLSKKTNNKAMESDISDVCANFNKAMKLFAKSTQKQIEKSNKEFEAHLIQKELNSHLVNEHSDPPKKFSAFPTLVNFAAKNEAMRVFPTRGSKFSGLSPQQGGVDVIEFISALNMAQEYCNLSEKEFKQMLLLCTTGRAHTLMAEWIRLGESVPTIYHNLLMNFDKRITPQSAQDLMFTYKAPKTCSLRDVETNLMLWASRAATSLPEGPARIAYYNMQIVQALIRSLPPTSSARVQSVYNSLSARLGRAATATELSKALNIDRHSIDLDIKQHGADRHSNTSTGNKFSKHKGYHKKQGIMSKTRAYHAPTTYSITTLDSGAMPVSAYMLEGNTQLSSQTQNPTNAQYTRESNHTRQSRPRQRNFQNVDRTNGTQSSHRNNGRQINTRNPNQRFRNGIRQNERQRFQSRQTYMNNYTPRSNFKNRRLDNNYCSLCGKKDHLAYQGCPNMVSDAGLRIKVMPTHTLCPACPPFVKPRLNHPELVCPYRKGGPFSKKN